MGRGNRRQGPTHDATDWSSERTMAAAEEDARVGESVSDTRCICGSEDFVLEAFMHVKAGRMMPAPVETGALTCPECGREYEAIEGGDGVILRGEYRGQTEVDDDEDEPS